MSSIAISEEPKLTAPHRGLSLRVNFMWAFAGNLVYSGTIPLFIVLIAKLGTPELVGKFALGIAITTPLFLFTNLILRDIQASDSRQEFLFADYIRFRIMSSGLALLVTAAIAFGMQYDTQKALIIFILGIGKSIESLTDIIHGLYQRNERMDYLAQSMIFRGVLALTATGAVFYYSRNLVWGVVAIAIMYLASLLVYDIPRATHVLSRYHSSVRPEHHVFDISLLVQPSTWNPAILKQILSLAFPLGLFLTLLTFNANLPRYFVEKELGERSLGIFAALSSLSSAGVTILSSLGQSVMPRLARFYAASHMRNFKRLLFRLIVVDVTFGIAGIAGALLCGRWLLSIVYTKDYSSHSNVLVWLMISSAIAYLANSLAYTTVAIRTFRNVVTPSVIVIGGTLTLCIVLVPRYGLVGAAWALSGSWVLAGARMLTGLIAAVKSKRIEPA